jgi:tRNA(fMet)-specific endonuclease VapC
MRVALDTNRYRDLVDGVQEVVAALEHAETIVLPFVVLAELRAGFALGTRGKKNARILHRFLTKPGVEVLYPTDPTTHMYASLYLQLRAQGTPIPTNDLSSSTTASRSTPETATSIISPSYSCCDEL